MQNFAIVTGSNPQGFPACFAAVTAHPGALTALRLGPNGEGRDIHIDPQEVLGKPMVRGLAIALEVIQRHPAKLVDRLRGSGIKGARLSAMCCGVHKYPVSWRKKLAAA